MTLVALLATLTIVAAEPSKESWVVLVRTEGSMPQHWRTQIQDSARKAMTSSDKVQWQDPPAVSMEEAELALGCHGWGPACAGQIATMMNAKAALVVELRPDGDGASMKTQVVTAAGEPRAAPKEVKLPDRAAQGLALAQASVVSAIRGSSPTIVVIDADEPGAEVTIDGQRMGRTPLTLVDELPAGAHELVLSKEGRAPLTTKIDVAAGKANPFAFQLGAGGPSTHQPTIGNQAASSSVMPAVAWVTTGAGAVLAVAAVGLAGGYGYTYVTRKEIADSAVDGVVPVGEAGGQQKTYKLMEDVAIPLAVGAVTAGAVGAVLVGTGVALLFVTPAE